MNQFVKGMISAVVGCMAVASAAVPVLADDDTDDNVDTQQIYVTDGTEEITTAAPEATASAETVEYTVDNTADVYRLYNPNSGEHFYTEDYTERDHLLSVGWSYEGIGWTAPVKDVNDSTPVYRLYEPIGGLHLYTVSDNEKNTLLAHGWHDEGVGWYSDSSQMTIPMYREYNPNSGQHNYTKNAEEDRNLISKGWKQEGIAWYGVNDPDPTITHPVTIYKRIDFSAIYDYSYYTTAYSDIASRYYGNDAGALEHFAVFGIKEGRAGKANYDQNVYNQIKDKLYPPKLAYPEAEWVFNVGLCARDLRAAYNFAKMPYVSGATDPSKGTHYYAHIGYSVHKGNCYVMAATFCELAKALGYNAVEVYGWDPAANGAQLPHSWVEIDGRIYDPEAEYELGSYNGWNRAYGERGTLRYHKLGYMGA